MQGRSTSRPVIVLHLNREISINTDQYGRGNMEDESGYRICMMSFLIAGLVMLWTGFNYLLIFFRPDMLTPDSYNLLKLLLSLVLIIMSLLMFRRNILMESIMLMYTGLSLFSFSLAYLLIDGTGSYLMDGVYCIPILTCTLIFILNKERLMSLASVLLSISMVYPVIMGYDSESIVQALCVLASGVVLMHIGFYGLYSDRVVFRSIHAKMDDEKVNQMLASVCLFIMSTYCIYTYLAPYDDEFFVAASILAFISLLMSISCLQRGVSREGMAVFMYSFSSVIFAVWNLLGGTGYAITDLAGSCVIGVIGLVLLRKRRFGLGIPFIIFAAITVPGFMYPEGYCWKIGSIILAVFLSYYCISRMIYIATGRKPLPVID